MDPLRALAVILLGALLLLPAPKPLWPDSRYTEADRLNATYPGLRFIYESSRNSAVFADYGSDFLWCFHSLSAATADSKFRSEARRMGEERAREWMRTHTHVPVDADAN